MLQQIRSSIRCLLNVASFVVLLSAASQIAFAFEIRLYTETLDGSVGAGNYTQLSFSGEGRIVLRLTTVIGDADLYVSHAEKGRLVEPTFALDTHHAQSVTCGDDDVDIEANWPRPIGIAVYGHPSHAKSVFSLELTAYEAIEAPPEDEESIVFYEQFFGEKHPASSAPRKTAKRKESTPYVRDDKESSEVWEIFISILAGLLRIVVEVLT